MLWLFIYYFAISPTSQDKIGWGRSLQWTHPVSPENSPSSGGGLSITFWSAGARAGVPLAWVQRLYWLQWPPAFILVLYYCFIYTLPRVIHMKHEHNLSFLWIACWGWSADPKRWMNDYSNIGLLWKRVLKDCLATGTR